MPKDTDIKDNNIYNVKLGEPIINNMGDYIGNIDKDGNVYYKDGNVYYKAVSVEDLPTAFQPNINYVNSADSLAGAYKTYNTQAQGHTTHTTLKEIPIKEKIYSNEGQWAKKIEIENDEYERYLEERRKLEEEKAMFFPSKQEKYPKKESPQLKPAKPKSKEAKIFNYGDLKPTILTKKVAPKSIEEDIILNKEEEVIINFVELADELALEVQKNKSDIKEYNELLIKYKKIILKHERTKKE